MELVFIYGPAAAGKLTVARALARVTGFSVFHNHLTVDALTAVFPFGSEPFVTLREQIWLSVFGEAARRGTSLIFTFTPERTVRPSFVAETIKVVESPGGKVLFVRLTCGPEELERRIEAASRREFGKLRSRDLVRELVRAGAFEYPGLPDSGLVIDTGQTTPQAAAARICDFFGLRRRHEGGQNLSSQLAHVDTELEDALRRAHALAASLDHARWARRPGPDQWSVAECLIHLNLTSRAFLPLIREAIATGRDLKIFGNGPYRRDVLGWFLSWVMEPPVRLPIKTTPPFVPGEIEAKDTVLSAFDSLQSELRACVAEAGGLDLGRLRIVSPFDSRIKYNLYSCLKIIPAHQRQHLLQAERALAA